MTNVIPWRLTLAALASALLLAACGGGGGGGASNTVASQPSTPVVTEPGAPTLSNNIAADGRVWINYRRGQLGIPVLTRNALIDTAAQGHSDYQKINNTVTHQQIAGQPGFTGVDTKARLQAANYVFGGGGYAGEVISATSSSSGFFMAEELITAVYHRFAIFEPRFAEIGTGAATTSANYTYFTADFTMVDSNTAGLGRGKLVNWPYSNQTLVPVNFFSNNEIPDPVDDVNGVNINEVGYPISVHADLTSTMTVSSFTVAPRGGSQLSTKLLAPSGDAHTPRSAAAIIPLSVLKGGTTYDVTFKGTVDAIAVERSWSFTTK